MVTPRLRTKSFPSETGTHNEVSLQKQTGKITVVRNITYQGVAKLQRMEDVTNGDFKTPYQAISSKTTRKGGVANGTFVSDSLYIRTTISVDKLMMSAMRASGPSTVRSDMLPARPTLEELATEAMSQSTPGRPTVSLPVAIGELRDLPRTFQSILTSDSYQVYIEKVRRQYWGRDHLRRTYRYRVLRRKKSKQLSDNSIVANEFGLLPLIRDFVNLFQLPKAIDDRLDRMRANSGVLVEHREVYSSPLVTEAIADSLPMHSDGFTVRCNRFYDTRESIRATVKWTPRWNGYITSDRGIRDMAAQYATGMSPDQFLAGAWELMPWSWLIDWFGNTGKYLAANSAAMNYTANVTMSMKRSTALRFQVTTKPAWLSASDGSISYETWHRFPSVVPLWAPISPSGPILGTKQLLILSSIALNLGQHTRRFPGSGRV